MTGDTMQLATVSDGLKAGATTFAPIATTPSSDRASGQRVTRSLAGRWSIASRSTRSTTHPNAKHIPHDPRGLASMIARGLFRLIQRVFIAEAVLWLTALVCALLGFPAVLTAFCVALVGFVVNCWLAVRTLGPFWRNLMKGGRA